MDNTYLLQSRRTEYLKKFQKTTTLLFIEGVYSIYNNVKKNNKSKRLLLKEFQQSMVDVSRWSQDIVRTEHLRFKKQCSVLDRLIRAIFDLDIVIKKDLCKNAVDFIPEPWDFVHQCYLNIARALWKQPFLVYDVNIDKVTVQQNKLKVEKIVSSCIQDTFTQYLPLDIEHDDVTNIDYSVQHNNQDIIQHSQDDVVEDVETNEDDVGSRNVTAINDSDVQEDFNLIQNDNHESVNEPIDINVIDDYVNVSNDEQCNLTMEEIDENDKISDITDDNNFDESDDILTNEEDLVYIDDNKIESDNDEIESVNDDVYESKSFDSEEIGDVDSVKSEELFVSRIDTQELQQEENIHQNEDDHHKEDINEIKEIFIGNKNEYKLLSEDETNLSSLPDVKVVHIDDSKSRLSSRKDALLNIKKKVKSSMHHIREMENSKYESYGDKLRVERKNRSFF
jgi:Family of unknown function (DUF5764)